MFFCHGLGDLIMFYPEFLRVREEGEFLKVPKDQKDTFDFLKPKDENDEEPSMKFYSVADKVKYCDEHELKIPYKGMDMKDRFKKETHYNPIVGFCLSSVNNQKQLGFDLQFRRMIYSDVMSLDFLPIEMNFKGRNNSGLKQNVFSRDCRDYRNNVKLLVSMTRSVGHFICGMTGNIHVAVRVLPLNKIMYIENKESLEMYYPGIYSKLGYVCREENYSKEKMKEFLNA